MGNGVQMEKVKLFRSLKWALMKYVSICVILSTIGILIIGFGTNELQDLYIEKYGDFSDDIAYVIKESQESTTFEIEQKHDNFVPFNDKTKMLHIRYWVISYAQYILIPLWILVCVYIPGLIFYKKELKKPISILQNASQKIADNQLDFKIEYNKKDELGDLCSAFEEMRCELYNNNREMWRSLEERKRLNSAFSHDLRTPLTVLKGYTEYLEKYVPGRKIPEEKILSVLSLMSGQITRLEHYTQKMSDIQKLENIVPDIKEISSEKLFSMLNETGNLICAEKFKIDFPAENKIIYIDIELVMQVYENLISNALRYAHKSIKAECEICENVLKIVISDDGNGFSEEALKNAAQPFFRDEKEPDKLHFGLGLYICRIICEKCGGKLTIENHEKGGKVTAEFLCKKIFESR